MPPTPQLMLSHLGRGIRGEMSFPGKSPELRGHARADRDHDHWNDSERRLLPNPSGGKTAPFPVSLSPIPFALEPTWPTDDASLGPPFELNYRLATPDRDGTDESPTVVALSRAFRVHQGIVKGALGGADTTGGSPSTFDSQERNIGALRPSALVSHASTTVVDQPLARQGVGEAPLPLGAANEHQVRGEMSHAEEALVVGEVAFPEIVEPDFTWFATEEDVKSLDAGAIVEGRVLDEGYLTACRFYHHDPRRPLPTNIEIAFRLGNYFGTGVSRSELRQVLRRCKLCRHFMYADARASHNCDSAPLQVSVDDPPADFVSVLLSNNESSGFPSQTLRALLTICSRCDHILQADTLATHDCSA